MATISILFVDISHYSSLREPDGGKYDFKHVENIFWKESLKRARFNLPEESEEIPSLSCYFKNYF